MHVRQQIREALQTLLSGLTLIEDRVVLSRVRIYREEDLPSLAIYTNEEGRLDEYDIIGVDTVVNSVEVILEVIVLVTDDMDERLDDISTEISTRLFADRTIDGLVIDMNYLGTEIELEPEAENKVGMMTYRLDVMYSIDLQDPETSLA